ncbi:hypothetical protein D3C87_538920 [compost metagenome]
MNAVASIPLNFTDVVFVKPLPVMVTIVFVGAVAGENDVITAPLQLEITVPFSVKSSSLKFPPVAPLSSMVTLTVPVNPVIGVLTFVTPIEAPDVGVLPFPTGMPLIDNAQF